MTRVAGFTPETARQLLGIVRDGRSTGKQSVVYPQPSAGTSSRPLSSTFNGTATATTTESDVIWEHSSTTVLTGTGDELPVVTNNGAYIEATQAGNYTIAGDFRASRIMVAQYESFKIQIKLNGDADPWGLMRGHLYAPAFDLAYANVQRTVTFNLDAGDKITVTVDSSDDMGIVAWLNVQFSR